MYNFFLKLINNKFISMTLCLVLFSDMNIIKHLFEEVKGNTFWMMDLRKKKNIIQRQSPFNKDLPVIWVNVTRFL